MSGLHGSVSLEWPVTLSNQAVFEKDEDIFFA
jgi:hypothetical protein